MRLLKPLQQLKQKAAPPTEKEAATQKEIQEEKKGRFEPLEEPLLEGEGRAEEALPSGEQHDGEEEQQQPHAIVDLQVRKL